MWLFCVCFSCSSKIKISLQIYKIGTTAPPKSLYLIYPSKHICVAAHELNKRKEVKNSFKRVHTASGSIHPTQQSVWTSFFLSRPYFS